MQQAISLPADFYLQRSQSQVFVIRTALHWRPHFCTHIFLYMTHDHALNLNSEFRIAFLVEVGWRRQHRLTPALSDFFSSQIQ